MKPESDTIWRMAGSSTTIGAWLEAQQPLACVHGILSLRAPSFTTPFGVLSKNPSPRSHSHPHAAQGASFGREVKGTPRQGAQGSMRMEQQK